MHCFQGQTINGRGCPSTRGYRCRNGTWQSRIHANRQFHGELHLTHGTTCRRPRDASHDREAGSTPPSLALVGLLRPHLPNSRQFMTYSSVYLMFMYRAYHDAYLSRRMGAVIPPYRDGDLRLAGDAGLAEAAGGGVQTERGVAVLYRDVVEVAVAFLLVMPLPAMAPPGTARMHLPQLPSKRRGSTHGDRRRVAQTEARQSRHHGAVAHRLSPGRDQAVAQPERPQTGRRTPHAAPTRRRLTRSARLFRLPAGRVHGRHRSISASRRNATTWLRSVMLKSFPYLRDWSTVRGDGRLPAVVESRPLGLRQDPADHGQFVRVGVYIGKRRGEDLRRGPEEWADIFLETLGIAGRRRGKSRRAVLACGSCAAVEMQPISRDATYSTTQSRIHAAGSFLQSRFRHGRLRDRDARCLFRRNRVNTFVVTASWS